MNKEKFNILMLNENWEYQGKPDISNSASDDPDFNWENYSEQNQYIRGNCFISITDEEIEKLSENNFDSWFKEKSQYYYFKDDWKKAFKGSEFLIPIVEKELENRKRFQMQKQIITLEYIKNNITTCDKEIDKICNYLEN